MNYAAVDKGVDGAVKIDVPAEWANAVFKSVTRRATIMSYFDQFSIYFSGDTLDRKTDRRYAP